MSAGTGIAHSERNDEATPTRIFQLWIKPRQGGGTPRWGSKPFPRADRSGRLVPLASGRGLDGALSIGADADVYGAVLAAGDLVTLPLDGDVAYLVPATGTVEVNGVRVATREGLALRGERSVEVSAMTAAELVLVVAARAG